MNNITGIIIRYRIPMVMIGIVGWILLTTTTVIVPPDCSSSSSTITTTSSISSSSPSLSFDHTEYVPATFELYVHENAKRLGLTRTDFNPSGCYLWNYDPEVQKKSGASLPTEHEKKILQYVPNDIRQPYFDHILHMQQYQKYITNEFILQLPPPPSYVDDITTSTTTAIKKFIDIRHALRYYNHSTVCNTLQVPWADTLLHNSQQQYHASKGTTRSAAATTTAPPPLLLSYIEHSSVTKQKSGSFRSSSSSRSNSNGDDNSSVRQYIEPLLPQLRNPLICENKEDYLLEMNYMVHDFYHICNHQMTSYSRTIFIDMGGSLLFHGGNDNPAMDLVNIYSKFGIIFDHIYAYEMTPFTPQQTKSLFESLIPNMWQTSYHWINTGVDSTINSNLNPFTMIKNHFTSEDFIIVKLDIDTPSVEHPLAQQLLNDPILHTLVDQFYFEYHVKLKELDNNWKDKTQGSVYDAMHYMTQLRQKGIAAHFWV